MGSEMCIRDRYYGRRVPEWNDDKRAGILLERGHSVSVQPEYAVKKRSQSGADKEGTDEITSNQQGGGELCRVM